LSQDLLDIGWVSKDLESEANVNGDDVDTGRAQGGATEAKFLCSLFARFRTTTTRGLRIPAARIRRDTFAYPDGAEAINDSQ
jgi:hypothetical protein